jgi:hypothetical protein
MELGKEEGERYLDKSTLVQEATNAVDYLAPNDKSITDLAVDDHIQISLAVSGFLCLID